ncbi:hypothetical protein O6H91_02G126200 [Diphasiastrum complanatum]|uniref:Uncharacterized protein n=2 Tax=Diphasiastrum complanatum TaxID=34168 RepID=A0ACC2EKF8_DIPCM|nr:hypothetical protein O6H91_02G126200 [Diphasiastrum complanatum]KAJ7566971.1 hypothetical protein O6H91_02G126200 [Diphasiastrum complanatum]
MGVASLHLDCSPETETSPGEAQKRLQWLERVESLLRNLLLSKANRVETRMWLCTALAALPVPSRVQLHCFKDLMLQPAQEEGSSMGGSQDARIVTEVLVRLMCENRAAWVAKVVAADAKLLRRFFSENPKRILLWFQHFGSGGQTDHKKGARALARFAFVHRETCWEELEWKGSHGQAPATVASKPHYFLELDVLQSVQNFLKNVPSFWSSEELWDSLKDGEFIFLDKEFFSHELLKKMLDQTPSEVWKLVKQYLEDESFFVLCHRILHLISDAGLLAFVNGLAKQLSSFTAKRQEGSQSHEFDVGRGNSEEDSRKKNYNVEPNWLEEVLLSGSQCAVLEDALLCSACAGHSRQILHLLHEEEHEEEIILLKELISEAEGKGKQQHQNEHWALRKESLVTSKWTIVKRLALEAWFLFSRLSANCLCDNYFEDIFVQNNIGFQKLDEEKGCSCETQEIQNASRAGKRKHRTREKKKRKRKNSFHDSWESESEIGNEMDLKHVSKSSFSGWRLSTDGYSSTLQKGDLADHLSGYAFGEWMKWTAQRW